MVSDEDNGQGMRWIEMAPTKNAETRIILHHKEIIAKMSPELNLVHHLYCFSQKILINCIPTYPSIISQSEKLSLCLPEEYLTLQMMKEITLP